MKIQKVANPEADRLADYRAAELEKTKALVEYVAIMADVEIPQDEPQQQEEVDHDEL